MKIWITVSEWYPVFTLARKSDIASSSDIHADIPDELWERWKLCKRQFETMQTEIKGVYYKKGGDWNRG